MVTLIEYIKEIEGEVLTGDKNPHISIKGGYVSDLLSDVMGNASEGDVWITIMRHLNVVAVASLAGLSSVVFSGELEPEPAVISKANDTGLCLVKSRLSTFECAGKLYSLLKQGDQE